MRLMSVVLPAPFGPISPKTRPSAIARSTAFTATTPPNRLVRAVASSNIFGPHGAQPRGAPELEQRREATRQVHDDEHEDDALEDVAVLLERLEDRRERGEEHRAEDRAEDVRDPADDGEHEDLHRAGEPELVRLDGEIEVRGESAGPARDECAADEGRELVAANRDALARRRDLVLADRGPGSTDARDAEPRADIGDHDEREDDVPELGLRRDPDEPLAATSDRDGEDDDPDHLAEGERRDRQVHPAQAEDRRAEGKRDRRREDRARGEGDRERDAGLHREERRAVRGDAGERRIAQSELAGVQGEPDREGEHRVEADEADRRLVRLEEPLEVVHQTRSTGRWPRMPRGRTSSTMKRSPKANASRSSLGRNARLAISPKLKRYAPSTAPGMLPIPPTIMTANAFSSKPRPICENGELVANPYRTPATPPTPAERKNVTAIARSTSMPSSRAARGFSASARSSRPSRVRRTR